MQKNNSWYFGLISTALLLIAACGGGGGGGGGSDDTSGNGADINDDWDVEEITCDGTYTGGTVSSGGASVVIADGTLSVCSNVKTETSPTLAAATSLPDGFDLSSNSTNVTDNGIGYTFGLNGQMGFTTTSSDSVTITLPFNPAGIPVDDLAAGFKVFVRIFNHDENSVVDLNGVVDDAGTITVNIPGLPNGFTAAVVYNPNMGVVVSDVVTHPAASISQKAETSAPPWPNDRWCVVYDAANANLIAAVQNYLGIATAPTVAQIEDVLNEAVVDNATGAQTIYETAGFRAPDLHLHREHVFNPWVNPECYVVHMGDASSHFRANDPDEVVSPAGNRYGRLYVAYDRIDDTPATSVLGSPRASVSHEMQHAIQNGYEWSYNNVTRGYWEGAATTYGVTIDQNAADAQVRSADAEETEMLSDFLMIGNKGIDWVPSYANQDFFAYVAREYNHGSLDYIAGLFEKIHDDVYDHAGSISDTFLRFAYLYLTSRGDLLDAMDSYFTSTFAGSNLTTIYSNFMLNRALQHNAKSRFGRAGEVNAGFADDLFQIDNANALLTSVVTVSVDASTCSVTGGSGIFSQIAPYAARVIKITPSATAASGHGPTLTVGLSPFSDSSGNLWGGYGFRNGATSNVLTDSMTFSSFGESAADDIYIIFTNTQRTERKHLRYDVTCEEGGGGGGGGGTNSFSISKWTITGESEMTPRYVSLLPPAGGGSSMDALVVSSSSGDQVTNPYIMIHFDLSQITGSGTYNLGTSSSGAPAYLVYVNPTTFVFFESDGGTMTLTSLDTASGDQVSGSFEASIVDLWGQSSGTLSASFDFIVGQPGEL